MSVIYITDHNENVFNSMKKATTYHLKSPRYISRYHDQVVCEMKNSKNSHRTFGFAEYPKRRPENYLKKHTSKPFKAKPDPCEIYKPHRYIKGKSKMTPVPSHIVSKKTVKMKPKSDQEIKEQNLGAEKPVNSKPTLSCQCEITGRCPRCAKCMCPSNCRCSYKQNSSAEKNSNENDNNNVVNTKSKRPKSYDSTNFVKRNIQEVCKAKPKVPKPRYVDTRVGTTHDLIPSGLQPMYIYTKVYGKTPKYILRLMEEHEREEQIKRDELSRKQPECRYITREERDDLLEGLKENWNELQKNYQGLPILTDTIPKISRKSQLEAELKQLEKDIVLLERHPYIYVYNDK